MNTIEAEWEIYAKNVYPHGMGEQQRKELHMAFFAGALTFAKLTIKDTDGLPVEEARERIVALVDEAKNTCKQVVARARQSGN